MYKAMRMLYSLYMLKFIFLIGKNNIVKKLSLLLKSENAMCMVGFYFHLCKIFQ